MQCRRTVNLFHATMKYLSLAPLWFTLLAVLCGALFWPSAPVAATAEPLKILRYQPVPMRDGVKLYADVYLPRAEGRYPTLVVRTPYGVQRDGVHETMMKFAQRGYAVVMNDTRGRYESEGKWEPFRSEAKDGYDTIQWASKQVAREPFRIPTRPPGKTGKITKNGGLS